jgi:hypothetical protein
MTALAQRRRRCRISERLLLIAAVIGDGPVPAGGARWTVIAAQR